MTESPRRTVRSFVRREGRMTPGQQRAFDQHWAQYGIDTPAGCLDPASLFGRDAPTVLEIGFGMGDSLRDMARDDPASNFIGVEVYRPGIGRLMNGLAEVGADHVRLACTDAVEFLEQSLPPASLDRIQIYFPDPWPKKKHHKRRLIQPAFLSLLASRLKPGGCLHLATDWVPYAEHMLEVCEASSEFVNMAGAGLWSARPAWRPLTKFERRGERLGHEVRDLLYRRR